MRSMFFTLVLAVFFLQIIQAIKVGFRPSAYRHFRQIADIFQSLIESVLLHAPVADERAAFEFDHLRRFNKLGLLGWDDFGMFAGTFGHALTRARWEGWQARAALASAPVAGEAQEDLAPPKCLITGRPFFIAIEHPELGWVPTYGGPFDSYTIAYMDGEANQPWHERDLFVRRYDHDLDG